MRWIVSSDSKIFVNRSHMSARLRYIQFVSGAEVTDWAVTRESITFPNPFFYCATNDGLNGIFITAHIGEVWRLCSLDEIAMCDFIIANTCIWERLLHKQVLYQMMKINRKAELWFSKQVLAMEKNYRLRQSTALNEIGEFGFNTSLSERILFLNRRKGFMKAVALAFSRVSPILLPEDYGGAA